MSDKKKLIEKIKEKENRLKKKQQELKEKELEEVSVFSSEYRRLLSSLSSLMF